MTVIPSGSLTRGRRTTNWSAASTSRSTHAGAVEAIGVAACHVATTDEHGRFARYKIVDPSFHNWPGLAFAMRQQSISDFPLCNKSFNLSYCGHDL